MAAHAYGTYSGINAAIKDAPDKSAPIVLHADHYRQMAALLCVVRTFATIDRGSEISLQSAYRYLQTEQAGTEIAEAYASSPPAGLPNVSQAREAIDRYVDEYMGINWKKLGNLQSFRNGSIAHIQWTEVNRFVTYGDLAELVRIISQLSGELTLMTTGTNNWPQEHGEAAHDEAIHKWRAVFAADAADKIDY
ncbi:MAG: hypothetical protein WA973_00570 [Mesorhizobium sp.]